MPSQVVKEYQRAVIFRLGKIRRGGARGPGLFYVFPFVDEYRIIDLRSITFDVPSQEVGGKVDRTQLKLLDKKLSQNQNLFILVLSR